MRSEPLLILLLILGAPLNHAGRNSTVIWGVNRQGCRFSRPAPWMARGGGPPKSVADYGHTERERGAEWWGKSPLGYFWGSFPKVTRRKGGTLSRRYRSNGYVRALIQHPGRLSGRHREQAPSHIWIARHQSDSYRPPGRHGSKLLATGSGPCQSCVDTYAPMAVSQLSIGWLTHRYRGQAPPTLVLY
ncbi:hypothetical protein QF045_003610 [Pseudomonas sp. W4I3]|nr:hypothetical protein [Pseudomonas sp. W4I3]